MLKRQSAFTLIEILMVLIILGILTAIAVPNLYSWIDKSHAAEAAVTLKSMADAYSACMAKDPIDGNLLDNCVTTISQSQGSPAAQEGVGSPNFIYLQPTANDTFMTGGVSYAHSPNGPFHLVLLAYRKDPNFDNEHPTRVDFDHCTALSAQGIESVEGFPDGIYLCIEGIGTANETRTTGSWGEFAGIF
ncbi:MAG: type II secretion system protein [Candidatus Omnitrophica bacterium]|nr:type II secretion system protein [Candidatus Omnitrophota bacterium]